MTSVNNPDASCENPVLVPALENPVQGQPANMISTLSIHLVASNEHTSSNTGISGCFFLRNDLASSFFSTNAIGSTISLRPCVIPPMPENKSSARKTIYSYFFF
ncbi:hypothetical protein AR158_C631L [Paramecium bursaria Chlorella virus AR158]|uniref:hypothetical protein n=1 Tax=Paramecium bursaria Chlorella virus AR158 TaxID=380598 RepID=UPI00015AA7F7|nr:hypothetical protein AR158_C631L [Paramecium bursaria Chlorella virus AR158]ABU44176.1 hypothetical protein AR158_C631L [Paramecium bursaria Chlorella virus AR158]